MKPAPSNALAAMTCSARNRSARLSTALSSAPATKPICTLIVSHDFWPSSRPNSMASCGTTAVAENHSVMISSSASASSQRMRHRSVTGTMIWIRNGLDMDSRAQDAAPTNSKHKRLACGRKQTE